MLVWREAMPLPVLVVEQAGRAAMDRAAIARTRRFISGLLSAPRAALCRAEGAPDYPGGAVDRHECGRVSCCPDAGGWSCNGRARCFGSAGLPAAGASQSPNTW